jgi:hypothetical protein
MHLQPSSSVVHVAEVHYDVSAHPRSEATRQRHRCVSKAISWWTKLFFLTDKRICEVKDSPLLRIDRSHVWLVIVNFSLVDSEKFCSKDFTHIRWVASAFITTRVSSTYWMIAKVCSKHDHFIIILRTLYSKETGLKSPGLVGLFVFWIRLIREELMISSEIFPS